MASRFTLSDLRRTCQRKLGTTTDYPFGDDVLAFRVGGRIFALCILERKPFQFNVKCDPDLAQILRATHRAVTPGYHMNKKHWNTVVCDGSIPPREILRMVDHAYDVTLAALPQRAQRPFAPNRRAS